MARLERLATRHGRTIIKAVEQMAALIVAGGGAAAVCGPRLSRRKPGNLPHRQKGKTLLYYRGFLTPSG
jgi:hypothetical protein